MTPIGKHQCDYLKSKHFDYEVVKYWDEEDWSLIDYTSMDSIVGHIPIKYCPFCGERLE